MNKRSKWIMSALLVVAIVFTSNYLISANQSTTISFGVFAGSYWDVPNGNSYDIFEDAIERFEKKFTNVKVEFVSGIRKEDYSEWLSKQTLKAQTPDVFITLGEDFSTFASVGMLENLDRWIEEDDAIHKSDYYDASLAAGQYHNAQYALPFESVPTLMYVNKTLLQKEGIAIPENDWTWEDFYTICQQVTKDTDEDGKIDQYGVYGYDWKIAAHANGAKLFSESGKTSYLNSAEVQEAVSFTKSLNDLFEGSGTFIRAQDFDEGNVAFCPMQFSQYRAYMPYPWRVKKYSNFEWDCIALPAGPQGGNVSEVSTLSMGMSAKSKEKQYAWEFLKMLAADETTQKNIFVYSQGVSTLKKVNQSDDVIKTMVADNPGNSTFEMHILNDVMKDGTQQMRFKKYDDAISMIDSEIYRIINTRGVDIPNELTLLQHKMDIYIKE